MSEPGWRDRLARRKWLPKWLAEFGEILTPLVLLLVFIGILLVIFLVAT